MALDFWRIACYYGEVETCGHIRVQVLLIGVDLNKKNRGLASFYLKQSFHGSVVFGSVTKLKLLL